MKVKSESEVAQSCPTLRDPVDYSPWGHKESDRTERLIHSCSLNVQEQLDDKEEWISLVTLFRSTNRFKILRKSVN